LAYLFRRFSDCQGKICNHEWKQGQKFSPLSGFDAPSGSVLFGYALLSNTKTADAVTSITWDTPSSNDCFGYSVASYDKTVLASAPGRDNNRRSVVCIYMVSGLVVG